MNWNEIKKLAIERGYKFKKHGGNHDIYSNGKQRLIIERHWSQEVRPGLMKRILKQLGE